MTWSEVRQERVADWVSTRFGEINQADPVERVMRFLEEAIELAQAAGISPSEIAHLVKYVYGRPSGQLAQEVAGVCVTLLAFAECIGIDLCDVTDEEIDRICNMPVDHFRKRHQAKAQTGIALPPTERGH